MKQLITCIIALLFGVANVNSQNVECQGNIELAGKYVSKHKATVTIYSYNDSTEQWMQIFKDNTPAKRYHFDLSPCKTYKILFIESETKFVKTLVINADYNEEYSYSTLDVDFENTYRNHAVLYYKDSVGYLIELK